MKRDISRQVKQLRAALKLTQHGLAERLDVRPQVVASWEQGRKVPSAKNYQQLARLASPQKAWFFLNCIGITKRLVQQKWPQAPAARPRKRPAVSLEKLRGRSADKLLRSQIRIPLLREGRSIDSSHIAEADIESILVVSET